jgi:hypothetical protein
VKPELGNLRSLPALPRKQDFLDITEDRREPLPYSEIVIGTFKTDSLAVDIQAKILLGEKIQPATETFLARICLGDPYCPRCSRSLDRRDAGWMADGMQIGYQCPTCGTQREGTYSDLFKDVCGQVRRNYPEYWQKYQKAIHDLTGGEPHKFKVP